MPSDNNVGLAEELPRIQLLGPSVSSRGERNAPRIGDERTVHSVRDASLEAANCLPARLAFRQFLPMVRLATRIAASLANGDHVHDLLLSHRLDTEGPRMCLLESPRPV
jgi:hypothetical protein